MAEEWRGLVEDDDVDVAMGLCCTRRCRPEEVGLEDLPPGLESLGEPCQQCAILLSHDPSIA